MGVFASEGYQKWYGNFRENPMDLQKNPYMPDLGGKWSNNGVSIPCLGEEIGTPLLLQTALRPEIGYFF